MNETLFNWKHDPLDEHSLASNNSYKVMSDTSGYVFVSSRSSGLSFYHSFRVKANTKKLFYSSNQNRIFDGFVGAVTQAPNGTIWLGSQGGLISLDMSNQQIRFHQYGVIYGEPIAGKEEVRALAFDKLGRLWVGLNRYGIVVLDQKGNPIRYFNSMQSDTTFKLNSNFIFDLKISPDDLVWVGTTRGLDLIDLNTLKRVPINTIHGLAQHPRVRSGPIYFNSRREVWIASGQGVTVLNLENGSTRRFTEQNGLSNKLVLALTEDHTGSMYVGGRKGVDRITTDKRIFQLSKVVPLAEEPCVNLLTDNDGLVWIAGDNTLSALDPASDLVSVFQKNHGLSGNGFRFNSSHKAANGFLFFGCNEGLSWFDPAALMNGYFPVRVLIDEVLTGKNRYYFSGNDTITFPKLSGNIVFNISTISLAGHTALGYQYQVKGFQKNWTAFDADKPIALFGFKPGTYTLEVRYTTDGRNWLPGLNHIMFTIPAAWWQNRWLQAISLCALLGVIYYLFRTSKIQRKNRLETAETENAILHLSTTIHGQEKVENLLWDITRHVISRLGFQDCVIYLLDNEKKVLIQKAAWGPKSEAPQMILNPIEIPLGKGIVGHVASTGIGEIISDTSKDPRYIIDDEQRFSEICIPIIDEGRVLGVIDSEHAQKRFFKTRHFTILQTIASVLGSKIEKIRAEEKKGLAEVELADLKRKSAEVEMQALRAQMNPHFMFNSLNSINNFILNNDIENASGYLTRFSRLMRLILDNSRHDWVPLSQELQALELYIGMESLRFDNAFSWRISVGEGVETEQVLIPPLLIQPYVENAIWHGLMHRNTPGGHLVVSLEKRNEWLIITIEDNGVGRQAAAQMKSRQVGHKVSHGMNITSERINMVNNVYDAKVNLELKDKVNESGESTGTSVKLKMKYRKISSDNHIK
jgi:putative methionine-R-sulfoxide reductase with GAF domain/streptogramin lyase